MKQIIGIFSALVLVPSMQVQAWIGGPWGNESYQANGDDGVYEAIGTMTDGTAMYRWSVFNENPGGAALGGGGGLFGGGGSGVTSNVQFGGLSGAASSHVIWYRGLIYYGRCFGLVNSHLKQIMVTGNATDSGLDGGNTPLNGVNLRPGSTSSLNITSGLGSAAAIPTRKSVANSTFKAKLDTSHPMKKFHGYGTIAFLGESPVDIVIVQLGIPGAGALPPSVIGPIPVAVGSATNNFVRQGHHVGMRVIGTQVSTQVR